MMTEYMGGFKPAKPEDLEKQSGFRYGKHKKTVKDFMESGETCVLKVFETRDEARKARNGINTIISKEYRGKALVSMRGKAVMIERL